MHQAVLLGPVCPAGPARAAEAAPQGGRQEGRQESRQAGSTVRPQQPRARPRPPLTVAVLLADALRADERRQPPHVPLEDALVHGEVRGAPLGLRGRARPAARQAALRRQPLLVVVVVAEDAVPPGPAAFATAPASSGEDGSGRGGRLLLTVPQQVPVLLAGFVVPAQRAQLLAGHRRRRPHGRGGGGPRRETGRGRRDEALRAAAASPVPSASPASNGRGAEEPDARPPPSDASRPRGPAQRPGAAAILAGYSRERRGAGRDLAAPRDGGGTPPLSAGSGREGAPQRAELGGAAGLLSGVTSRVRDQSRHGWKSPLSSPRPIRALTKPTGRVPWCHTSPLVPRPWSTSRDGQPVPVGA